MRVTALLLLLVAAGCTPTAYWRPGVTAAQAQADAQSCRGLAAAEALPDYVLPGWHYRRYGDDILIDRMQDDSRPADFCMQDLGYRLTPTS